MRTREALRISGYGSTCIAIIVICSFACSPLVQIACAEDAPPGLEDVPAVVAEVNGHSITREDLVRELAGPSGQLALGRLMRRLLVEQAAAVQHITVSDDEIEAQYKVDARDLMNELIHVPWVGKDKNAPAPSVTDVIRTRFNMNIEEYKKLVVRQKLLIRRCVAKDISPTQAQLREFFEGRSGGEKIFEKYFFQPPARYHACHILISPMDPRDWHRGLRFRTPAAQMTEFELERKKHIELYRDNIDLSNAPSTASLDPEWKKARALAEKVLRDIRSGTITWDQALRTYTQDRLDVLSLNPKTKKMDTPRSRFDNPLPPGDVGWFTIEGPLVRDFYEGAKNLRPGGPNEIGGPVQTEFGFHLIKMVEVKEEQQRTFDQCQAEVEKAYIEYVIQNRILPVYSGKGPRQPGWLDLVMAQSNIVTEEVLLWPPRKTAAMMDPLSAPAAVAHEDPDPIVAHVNTALIRRSDIWRELLRYDSNEALTRLIHREMILTMLKPMGVARMDWECGRKDLKQRVPAPALEPIENNPKVTEVMEQALSSDRLRLDLVNTDRKQQKELVAQRRKDHPSENIPEPPPEFSFADYIYRRYGRTVEEYRRSLEATAVLMFAIRKKVPVEDGTLKVEFALARDQYSEPAWYEISHILIPAPASNADDTAKLQARMFADDVLKECNNHPEAFEELAVKSSEDVSTRQRGGLLGACYVDGRPNPNQLYNASDVLSADDIKIIYEELKSRKIERGHIAPEAIRTSRGFHIVRADAVHPERKVDFEEVRDKLRYDYVTQHAKMICDIWLQQLETDNESRIKRYFGQDDRKLELTRDDVPDNWDKSLPKPDAPKKK
jgi:parvulin-like peptidyl-prolyl isomerase